MEPHVEGHRRASTGARRGVGLADGAFTVVELLIVIAVVGLLLALALPAIGGARRSAYATKSLANLRTIGETFEMYQQTWDSFPFAAAGWANPPFTEVNISYGFFIWQIRVAWPVLMHDTAPWPENAGAWVSPGADDPNRFSQTWTSPIHTYDTRLVSYEYSYSFIADPALWDGRVEASDWLVRAQHAAGVRFPSQKVLAFDRERAYLGEGPHPDAPRPVLMADGSASLRRDQDARPPVPNPLNPESGDPYLYHDTADGIGGRDF